MLAKNMAKVFVIATATGLAGSAAMAADPTAADVKAAAKPADDLSKRVCRVVTPTGSRFTSRVCMTAAEWQKESDNAQEAIDREARGNRDLDERSGAPR